MKVVIYRQFGSPEVLRLSRLPTPVPRDREVRIRVAATTVTAAESGMRQGLPYWGRTIIGMTGPRKRFRVLGNELAGVVDAVGRHVTRFAPGDEVFGFAGFNPGANAEYICLPETASLCPKPTNKTFDECVAAVDGATTALHFLRDLAQIRPGQRVVIVGASGSIGTFAVQLARRFGAHVVGVCSGRNAALVSELGAHQVVDYNHEDFGARLDDFDIVFDTVGKSSFGACKRALRSGGQFLATAIGPWMLLQSVWTRFVGSKRVRVGMSVEKNEALRVVRDLLEANELRVVIDRTYPLEQIVAAHRHVDTGHKRGNVVIRIGSASPG